MHRNNTNNNMNKIKNWFFSRILFRFANGEGRFSNWYWRTYWRRCSCPQCRNNN